MHGKLLFLFPDYKPGDWVLHDEGAGPFIKRWRRPEPEPNAADLNAVTPQQESRAYKEYLGERRANELSDIDLAWTNVLAPKLGMSPQELRQALRAELRG